MPMHTYYIYTLLYISMLDVYYMIGSTYFFVVHVYINAAYIYIYLRTNICIPHHIAPVFPAHYLQPLTSQPFASGRLAFSWENGMWPWNSLGPWNEMVPNLHLDREDSSKHQIHRFWVQWLVEDWNVWRFSRFRIGVLLCWMFLTYFDVHAEDRIAYVTVLAACAGARQWDEALAEFSFLPLWIGACGILISWVKTVCVPFVYFEHLESRHHFTCGLFEKVLKLYADVEERFPQFIGPDMMLPTIAAMCEVDREEDPRLGHIGVA